MGEGAWQRMKGLHHQVKMSEEKRTPGIFHRVTLGAGGSTVGGSVCVMIFTRPVPFSHNFISLIASLKE